MPRTASPLRVALLGQPQGWHVRRLAAALARHGHSAAVVGWEELAAEIDGAGARFHPAAVDTADVVVVRGMPGASAPVAGVGDTDRGMLAAGGMPRQPACNMPRQPAVSLPTGPPVFDRLERVIFRMDLLARLAARGTAVVNTPAALEAAIDKYLSLARLAAAGLPIPRTIVAQGSEAALQAWRTLGGDCVVKPLFGSRGRDIQRLTREDEVAAWFAFPGAPDRVIYLQEFVRHPGWDARLLVVGDATFSMRRRAPAGDWRTNVSRGGRPEPCELPAEWVAVGRRAATILEAEIAGVDLVSDDRGHFHILEVNAVPGWRALESVTGADVTGTVARYLENRRDGAEPGFGR